MSPRYITIPTTRRIYAASLADYNAGNLHGVWVDVTDPETMQAEISAMLQQSEYPNVMVPCPDLDCEQGRVPSGTCPTCKGLQQVPSAEEWQVHDYDGDWYGLRRGETSDLDALCTTSDLLDEHGEAWARYVECVGEHYATADGFADAYQGCYRSLTDYAEQYTEDTDGLRGVPDHLRNYIDYEAMGRDFEMGGDISAIDGTDGTYIFSNH